jgi:hypothetical protein
MRWTVTIKDQTYGTGTEILTYACRVTRSGSTVRLSVQNSGPGAVKEGRCLIPSHVASILGKALLLAAAGNEPTDFMVSIDEAKAKKS